MMMEEMPSIYSTGKLLPGGLGPGSTESESEITLWGIQGIDYKGGIDPKAVDINDE